MHLLRSGGANIFLDLTAGRRVPAC